jgi:DNA repair exonuclease SbcCD ATPase subunit
MIRSIHLENFKKHHDFRADFSDGLAAVTGENAQGKSTILKGILFALLGPTATGHKVERIPTRGAEGSTTATLEISLPVHGDVKIERTLKGAKVWAKDGTLLANGTTPVIKLIEEAYGMSAADLQLLMYSKQGQSQALLEFGATALQKTIERLAKSDLVDKILDMVGKDVTSMEGQLTGLGEVADLGKLREEVDMYQTLIKDDNLSLKETTNELRNMQDAETNLRQRYEQAQSLSNKLEQMNFAITSRKDRVKALNASIQETSITLEGFEPDLAERANIGAANIEAMQQTWSHRKQRLDQAQTLSARINTLAQKQEHLNQVVGASSIVAGKLQQAQEELAQLSEVSTRLDLACDAAKAMLASARDAVDKSVCHECQRPFNEEERLAAIKRQEEAVDAYEALYQQWSDAQTPLRTKLSEVAELRKAYNPGAADLLAEITQQLEDAQADFVAALQGFHSIEDLASATMESKVAMDRARATWADMTSRVNTQTSLQAKLADLQQRVTEELMALQQHEADLLALPPVEDIVKLRLLLDQSVQQVRAIQDRQSLLQTQVAGNQIRLLASEDALERAEKAQESRKCLITEIDLRKRLQVWLRKSRADLMIELWDNMLAYASHLISTTTSGELSRVYREDGELMVDEQGDSVAVTELSGYQRSLVGLALRIAMSRVFYGDEHMLLLDEPTADASSENAARIAGMLQSLGSQVIYVTHREGDAVNADVVIAL